MVVEYYNLQAHCHAGPQPGFGKGEGLFSRKRMCVRVRACACAVYITVMQVIYNNIKHLHVVLTMQIGIHYFTLVNYIRQPDE